MKASEDLRKEHELILVALDVLEKIAEQINKNETLETKELQDIVDFVIEFADKCHHGKEEGLYFPTLEKVGIPRENGPVGMMLYEHELGRNYIRRMKESGSDGNENFEEFAQAAEGYTELMKNHIYKENNILFMMGDNHIPEATQKELLEKFDEHESSVIGNGRHEELHNTLEKMEAKYL